ncbi:unsaturated rhamnogalacturonyl hydrolase [Paraburkholderia sp. BL6665CI2N2]|uniref:glycoside hydrolase family 88 protein n=1 Tax=Paraburkholderia sp. BL6665CI2N2 TaxID=1938806 RepID=UPI001064AD5A|nr:glycoside hydrolase family 88 protein [Paraburkholderia sp. BL6665CI2N2]TDY16854.1 unsaturated rhamnogalacturonyl hydrolase [Paraburkholderia sp. BL6665CI2N2]
MGSTLVKRILERGWDRVDTGGKHSGLLNAMYTAGLTAWFHEKIGEVLASPVITHPNIADSSSRIRPLILAGKVAEAKHANEIFHRERVAAGGVTQHTTAKSTHGWVFADTAYMVAPSQAIIGNHDFAIGELKGFHTMLAQEDGLLRHVFNASVPVEETYIGIDLWIDGTAWGRASGWWLAGVVDSLEAIPEAEWDRELVAMYEKTVARATECQDGGLWHATIDDPYSLIDTSATVMIAYALNKGYQLGLGGEAAERASFTALEAVLCQHFDWRTSILRHQQFGPMVVNIPSPNPRYLDAGNAYGQGFLAALFALASDGVRVRDLGARSLQRVG